MTTIEAPARQQTIQIEENENQKIISEMIRLAKAGYWCRDTTHGEHGRGCTLGLIHRIVGTCAYELRDEVADILDRTIPTGALDGERGEFGKMVNGGTSRGKSDALDRVCSYNNTVRDVSEIIEWYEAARLNA